MSPADPVRAARRGLALRVAALVLALLTVLGVGLYAWVHHVVLASVEAGQDLAMRSVLEAVRGGGEGGATLDHAGFVAEVDELRATLDVVAVDVFRGDALEASAPAGARCGEREGPASEAHGEGVEAVRVRRDASAPPLVVVLCRRTGSADVELGSLRAALFAAVPLGALGALGVGWLLAGAALAPVDRALARQRAFMADASHELRTPLAVLRAQAEVRLAAPDDPARARDALAIVARTATRAGALVDDLLVLARADARAPATARVRVALDELVEETAEAFAGLAARDGRALRVMPGDDATVDVDGDPLALGRMLGALVANALAHGAGDVDVTWRGGRGHLEVEVADRGPGVPAELLPRVFDRFVRGSPREGHGLGLAVARSVAEAHGGRVRYAPREGGGARFVVTLPRA